MSVSLIIPAAGTGSRFHSNIKKQFYLLDDKPIIYFTIKRLYKSYNFKELIIGLKNEDIKVISDILDDINIPIPVHLVTGGKERLHTVYNCILKLSSDYALIHDSVRPFVNDEVIINTIKKAKETGAAICGMPVRDTVKQVNNTSIEKTLSRDNLFLAHTPQVFKKEIIEKALKYVIDNNIHVTDDASACEHININVHTVLSNYENIKITYLHDIDIISILKNRFFRG